MDENVTELEEKFENKAFPGVKGDATQIRVRMSASYAEEISELITRRLIHRDIGTVGQFIRDAVVHRLNYIRQHIGDVELAAKIAGAIATDEIAHEDMRYEGFETEIKSLEKQLDRAWKEGDFIYCRKLLGKGAAQGQTIHVPHLRDKLVSVLKKYNDLLNGVQNDSV
jgi:hypothetical protein